MAVQAFWFRLGKHWEHHAWACWHLAAFQRSKKLPEFKQLFRHPASTQTAEQQSQRLRALTRNSSPNERSRGKPLGIKPTGGIYK
jgi:hypothetical protein